MTGVGSWVSGTAARAAVTDAAEAAESGVEAVVVDDHRRTGAVIGCVELEGVIIEGVVLATGYDGNC